MEKRGYKLVVLSTRKIIVSRNVRFHENIYLFFTLSNSQPSFPTPIFTTDHSISQANLLPNTEPNFFSPDRMNEVPNTSHLETKFESQPVDRGNSEGGLNIRTLRETQDISPSTVTQRKSERTHKRPSYLEEYVCNAIVLTNLTNTCFNQTITPKSYSFASLSTTNQQVLNSISNITEPTSYAQAELHPGWKLAMEDEIEARIEINPEKWWNYQKGGRHYPVNRYTKSSKILMET